MTAKTPAAPGGASLESLQAMLAEAILAERPLAEEPELRSRAERVATGNGRLSPADQVEIYREQFWLRHEGSLEEDYPTLRHLLGAEGFQELCRAYLRAHPPRGFSLRDLAGAMPRFVTRTAPYWEDALLADCANTEWAFIEAFDAPDAPPFDPSVLTSTDEDAWAGARLVFHPSVRFLALSYPAHEFRAGVRLGEEPGRPKSKRTYLVVHRANDAVHCTPVEPMAFALLERLARDVPLGEACEAVAAADEDADIEAKIAPWFQAWVGAGWICEVRV
ncbi:putative DNA-binding domain-containing protein [Pendulispora albinea]|uniref:DNA-binding domain-containing protein n=1 Tax=Pendulispora albinea TaxID=2741071 RepID=A0ABZ2LWJ3_9BACT